MNKQVIDEIVKEIQAIISLILFLSFYVMSLYRSFNTSKGKNNG